MKTLRLALAALLALPLVAAEPRPPRRSPPRRAPSPGNLMLSLQGELFAAMKDGGPVKALDVCRVPGSADRDRHRDGDPLEDRADGAEGAQPEERAGRLGAAKLEEFRKRLAVRRGADGHRGLRGRPRRTDRRPSAT